MPLHLRLLLVLILACAIPGCTRTRYRTSADRDAYGIVSEKSHGIGKPIPGNFTVRPDRRSRFYDPTNPDWPRLPVPRPVLRGYELPRLASDTPCPDPMAPQVADASATSSDSVALADGPSLATAALPGSNINSADASVPTAIGSPSNALAMTAPVAVTVSPQYLPVADPHANAQQSTPDVQPPFDVVAAAFPPIPSAPLTPAHPANTSGNSAVVPAAYAEANALAPSTGTALSTGGVVQLAQPPNPAANELPAPQPQSPRQPQSSQSSQASQSSSEANVDNKSSRRNAGSMDESSSDSSKDPNKAANKAADKDSDKQSASGKDEKVPANNSPINRVTIPAKAWEVLPKNCIDRMLEFQSLRTEFAQTFKGRI